MMITHFSAWLMVAAGGLFSGGIFFVAVERLNLWRRMPVDQTWSTFAGRCTGRIR
jgi:hypothetical protein